MKYDELAKMNLVYCPKTGLLRWTKKTGNKSAGAIAGSVGSSGYISVQVKRKRYFAHRLAFVAMTGGFPCGVVDHINGKKNDNRWANLRDCSQSKNMSNRRGAQRNSKTGLIGASPHQSGKFIAQIRRDKKHAYLGLYNTAEDAHAAYKRAAREQQ